MGKTSRDVNVERVSDSANVNIGQTFFLSAINPGKQIKTKQNPREAWFSFRTEKTRYQYQARLAQALILVAFRQNNTEGVRTVFIDLDGEFTGFT